MSDTQGSNGPDARRIVDCDIHHEADDTREVLEYLPAGWRAFVEQTSPEQIWPQFNWSTPHGGYRHEAVPADGTRPASNPDLVRDQLLDPHGITDAVLTHARGLYISSLPNPHLASEVSTAINRHTEERWLAEDERFLGSLTLATQHPERAADEIRRGAKNPRFVQAITAPNGVGHGFGHPTYAPIHRALAETGLPLAIHALGEGSAGAVASPAASSVTVSFYTEFHTAAMQGMMTHLMSFILHGVFEQYPNLRVVLTESGITWLPALLRRLDENFKGLRVEAPWCRKLPSEYFHDHFLVTTQPLDIENAHDPFVAPLEAYGIQDVLVFSSDYPHWDADNPANVRARLPEPWREDVFWRNAARVYGLSGAAAPAPAPGAASA